MAGAEDHRFDRRSSDVNVSALATRMKGLEGRIEVLEEQSATTGRELKRNTEISEKGAELAREVHEAVFGVEGEFSGIAGMARQVHGAMFDEGGVKDLVKRTNDIVEPVRNFFEGLARWSGRSGQFADWVSDVIRRRWWLILAIIAGVTYFKTGRVPDWVWKVIGA